MNNIEIQYISTNALFEENRLKILSSIDRSKTPFTSKAMYHNIAKIDFVLSSIKSAENNFYSSQILTRVLFEHFLVGYFLFTKCREDKSDEIGSQYEKEYLISEYVKQQAYELKIEKIKDPNSKQTLLDFLRNLDLGMEDADQKDLDELHRIGNFFDIKNIGNYLIKSQFDRSSGRVQLHEKMLDFLNRYNHLSTFVHGGPHAALKTFSDDNVIKNQETAKENILWGYIASKESKTSLLLLLFEEFPDDFIDLARKMLFLRP